MIKIEIKGEPMSKQSARFRIAKNKTGKQFIHSYQSKKTKNYERDIAAIAKSQLPPNFKPLDGALAVSVHYIFELPKSSKKSLKTIVETGLLVWKDTKPDLTDNLNKALFDSLQGIVYTNDSRIAKVMSFKAYGKEAKTTIKFYELPEKPFEYDN